MRHRALRCPVLLCGWLLLLCLVGCRGPSGEAEGPQVEILIEGATILTMDQQMSVLDPGFIAIEGDSIVQLGRMEERPPYRAAVRIDARDTLILPGLINGHQHAPMVLFRGLGADLALMDWLQNYIFPAEAQTVDEEFVYWGTQLAVSEMLLSGTTLFVDMYYFEDAVARAAADLGMRAIAGQTVIGFPAPDHPTPEQTLEATRELIERWKGHPLVTPAVAPHAPFTCSREILEASRALAEETGVPLLIHLAETADEVSQVLEQTGRRPVGYLEEIGFLSPRVIAAHGVWVSPDEIQVLARAGVGVIHNPESNMKLASGTAPVTAMQAAGVAVGLGTDGAASNDNLDLFEAMDFAAKLAKHAGGDPTLMNARTTLLAATREGARAIGRDDIGSLEKGKKADLVILDLESPSAQPIYDPYSSVVYSLKGGSVRTVLVNGRIVVRNRVVTGLDSTRLEEELERLRARVLAAVQH